VPPLFGAQTPFSLTLFAGLYLNVTAGFVVALAVVHVIHVLVIRRPRHVFRTVFADLRDSWFTPERLAKALPVLVLFPVFISAFGSFKSAIPAIQPFVWDAQFAAWDKWLHGGRYPFEWLLPVIGHPQVTFALNVTYHLWFFLAFGMLFWQAVTLGDQRLRLQFILSNMLVWSLLGSLVAVLLSSAGPCYFGRVTGQADPFVPLMDYLRSANETAPVFSLAVQDKLWQAYVNHSQGIVAGISAMPSLHVAVPFCYTLLGFAKRRALGMVLAAFTGLILIGSVHLGWHYAIDGYVSIACTFLIWRAVGWLLRRRSIERALWGDRGPALS
jgi:PAP2 superfamily